MNWLPIHSGIAACMLDGMTREQMSQALNRSPQGLGYRIKQMREMLGVPERNVTLLIGKLVRMADDGKA